jgi:hypothetical protein
MLPSGFGAKRQDAEAKKIPGGQSDRPVFLLEGRKKEREEDY